MFLKKSCRENLNTRSVDRALYEIKWKNILETARSQMAIWRMRVACCIPKPKTRSWNMYYLLLFHCKSGCTNEPQCYVIFTLRVCFILNCLNYLNNREI